jgi:hypothetical protein
MQSWREEDDNLISTNLGAVAPIQGRAKLAGSLLVSSFQSKCVMTSKIHDDLHIVAKAYARSCFPFLTRTTTLQQIMQPSYAFRLGCEL